MILYKNYNQERRNMKKEEQKQAILEKQFDMAMNGSVEMLKWLGIQLCGQDNKPTKGSEPLPQGFDVGIIPSREVEEYEENKEMFNAWKLERDMQVTLKKCKESRLKYERGKRR